MMARPTKAKAIERLRKVYDEIDGLIIHSYNSSQFQRWRRNTRLAIAHTFGDSSSQAKDFEKINYFPFTFSSRTTYSKFQRAYVNGLAFARAVLGSMIEEIEEYWDENEQQSSRTPDLQFRTPPSTKKIFVVHGHDESARESVARFLEKMKLDPVILHEQPNEGRTIIEKFEQHADVGFAVVLLTPDDMGGSAGDGNNLKLRARQNVILELGFFLGKLGRARVCALVKGNVETPSDYDGVVYTPLDGTGGWKHKLIQELKAAGFGVDANLAL